MDAENAASECLARLHSLVEAIQPKDVAAVARTLKEVCQKGATVFVCGNGGSASTASLAIDLGTPVIAMTGFSGGALQDLGTTSLHVDCPEYGPVEDLHLVSNHLLVVTLRAMLDPAS